ncbi:MAG: hypothetical protein CBD72_05500 [Flavobacteriaceae bacterium TMED212]|nr:MAG: hypothetical protein CBD72_05500 [Flavobacteriaceae bacterium TMED212]|tara:strand:- start:265 stop:1257 length:993 start_codon:yes stop_codon:yes gene_type:complete
MINSAIVVLNWNDWRNTIDCLESIYQNNGDFDVFLIDNGSNFENIQRISNWHNGKLLPNRNFIKPKLKNYNELIFMNLKDNIFNKQKNIRNLYIFRNKKNLGLTAGLNQAYSFLIRNKYDYILRIDNDFIIPGDYFKKIIKTIKPKDIASASPKIMHAFIKKSVWFQGFKMKWSYLKFQRTMNLQKKRYFDNQNLNKIIETDVICGCCSIYKSYILKKSGLGDEDFFYGPEDMELSYRLKKYGKLICNQKIKTFHKIARSSSIAKTYDRTYQSTHGFLILIKKIGTLTDKLFGYSFFIIRGLYYFFFLKNHEKKQGYFKALKFFFVRNEK